MQHNQPEDKPNTFLVFDEQHHQQPPFQKQINNKQTMHHHQLIDEGSDCNQEDHHVVHLHDPTHTFLKQQASNDVLMLDGVGHHDGNQQNSQVHDDLQKNVQLSDNKEQNNQELMKQELNDITHNRTEANRRRRIKEKKQFKNKKMHKIVSENHTDTSITPHPKKTQSTVEEYLTQFNHGIQQKVVDHHLGEAKGLKPNMLKRMDSVELNNQLTFQNSPTKNDKNAANYQKQHSSPNQSPNKSPVHHSRNHRTRRLPSLNENVTSNKIIVQNADVQNNEHESSYVLLDDKLKKAVLGYPNIMESIEQIIPQETEEQVDFVFKTISQNHRICCKFIRQDLCCSLLSSPKYSLRSTQNNVLLMHSKKERLCFNSFYNISANSDNLNQRDKHYFGFIRGNFGGNEFNLFSSDSHHNLQNTATICYQSQLTCLTTFRKIQIFIKNPQFLHDEPPRHMSDQNLKNLYYSQYNSTQKKIIKLVNKAPVWNQKQGAFTLKFGGKNMMPSVKNVIFHEKDRPERNVLLFYKQDRHDFHMEIDYPLSPFLAMGIILTSFDFKLYTQ